jgi:hypothetical protein
LDETAVGEGRAGTTLAKGFESRGWLLGGSAWKDGRQAAVERGGGAARHTGG